MAHVTLRASAIALCATALAALTPLSAGAANTEIHPHGAAGMSAHGGAGMATHGALMRPSGGTAMHGGGTFRSNRQFASTRSRSFERFHMADRDRDHRRFGHRGHFYRYGFAGVGVYPYYSGGYYAYGYGYPRHSCWWYRHYDPVDMPAWCGTYGYSYTYEPGYVYGYDYSGPAVGYEFGFYGYRHGRHERRFAYHGSERRIEEGRAASVGGFQGGTHNEFRPHNFGAAHMSGGAQVGGAAHIGVGGHAGATGGGHLIQH